MQLFNIMALGLIQFLMGGKKKKSNSKSGKVAVPVSSNNQSAGITQNNQVPDGVTVETANVSQKNSSSENKEVSHPQQHGSKKSISEALLKIHTELKESNERLTGLVTDVKTIESNVNSLTSRVDSLDKKSKETDEKFSDLDNNMSKFLSLYELINNQYNPFVSNDSETSMEPKIVLSNEEDNSNGTLLDTQSQDLDSSMPKAESSVFNSEDSFKPVVEKPVKTINLQHSTSNISQSLLELDTLNIEEAAADCVPLTKLKNNTNGLVIILSWLEYLIAKVGVEESRNTLRYYTETLRWLTPEVFFDLDKYLRGMNDVENPQRNQANVKDHIVSLYFISKLNEKSLDHRLTKAVLDIIQN